LQASLSGSSLQASSLMYYGTVRSSGQALTSMDLFDSSSSGRHNIPLVCRYIDYSDGIWRSQHLYVFLLAEILYG
jgi:hypothetical protein